ncbi:MAG: IS1 family transposase [Candidatus Thermoplasmatota archaeon]
MKHYKDAILKVYGVQKVVKPTGGRGRPRKSRVYPVEGLDYAVVHKERRKGRVIRVTTRVVFGSLERIKQKLRDSPVSKCVNTSFVERNNLSIRAGGARFARKTLCFSKRKELLIDFLNIYFGYYHLCRPHRGCRGSNGEKQTPFMKAGLTDHVWSIEEVLNYKF